MAHYDVYKPILKFGKSNFILIGGTSSGWEGSAHDSCILSDSLTCPRGFKILEDVEPFWNFQTQVDIMLVCCIIHNHIMGVDPNDLLNQGLYEDFESNLIIQTLMEREEREKEENGLLREEIAPTM
ncbi:hypothetical protein J1N35_018809 [Gossypium stocksii]|uniref:DDE Tnp4 domain-containing protein n=1 Tax=Gossypium stocksii TaxID=47602 RepID=A0A9D4A5A5_9ROSI|nr:hypothetical protein J1N35_018809 [Gossypium stocksii]